MFESLKLADITKKQDGILRKQTSTSPVIWRVAENGVKAIVKDYSYNGFWFRNIIGRFLIWREKKAYKRLEGLSGVPALFGSLGGIALIIEEIQGIDIGTMEARGTTPDKKFFRDFKKLIDIFHERGIAHCDLKRALNIIIGDDGNPYIIDWAASISKSEFRFFPLNLIYERFVLDDLNAITKIKLKYCPESVSPEEKRRYTERSRAEKIIRTIKDLLKDFLKKVA
jgi:RIO-like serine/threonine protein kinase